MQSPDWQAPLGSAYDTALQYLAGLPDRPVGPRAAAGDLAARLHGPLPLEPTPAETVISDLADGVRDGLLPSGSGRFFGFVFGGATPAALAADWLTSVWDQNAGLYAAGPAASVAEECAGRWLIELLGLPTEVSFAFVTGAQMANFTALAAARHEVLRRESWDVETKGLTGAPRVRVFVGAERHDSIDRALRYLGLGAPEVVAVDDQGRIRPDALHSALLAGAGPAIVCAQAGDVNSGAFDPIDRICDITHGVGGWLHVDGAFGLWAAVSERLAPLLAGHARADSWTTDAHKWLNVPYDSGLAFCAHPAAHRAAMSIQAAYLIHDEGGARDQLDYNPEFSRRARGFPVYAAIRALGRTGIAEMVERTCGLARLFARQLDATTDAEVLNDVVVNQVLVRFLSPDGEHDDHTRRVVARVQNDGTCWMSGTTWRGRAAMRISVSNWSTDESDVDRSVEAILRCAAEDRAERQ